VGLSLLLAGVLAAVAFGLRRGRTRSAAGLEVVSSPPGCGVRLDGRYVGIAPLSIENIPPGEHFVEVSRQGYRAETVRVEVAGGRPAGPLRVVLEPLALGRLEVHSEPPGATVALDGENRGNAPLTLEGISPGLHRLVLRRARYEPWSKTVEVRADGTTPVSARLEDSFLKFLKGAVAAEPRNMTHRSELFHYMMSRKEWRKAADSFFEALSLMARQGVPDAGKGGLWYWFSRDAAGLRADAKGEFGTAFGDRLAELASEDAGAAVKVLKYLGARTRTRSRWLRNPELLRKVYFTAAARAAAHRPVVEAALELAADFRSSAAVEKLLAASAKARPGDGEHAGWLAVKILNLIKSRGIGGSFRGEALEAASDAVEKALAEERKDAVLEARLRRMLAKIRALQEKPGKALAELDKAIAGLKAAGGKEAARLETWRLERALLLARLGRIEEARRLLKELAAGAAEAGLRGKAAAELKKLPAPKSDG